MSRSIDVAVVGGGIVGLAHAWMAIKRGLTVAMFDRSPRAQGATVRNFGMIWPIGQPAGELYATALRSRALWLELAEKQVVDIDRCGSVHLAHRHDELAVLEEFHAAGTHDCKLLTKEETLAAVPIANPEGLLGGLISDTELRVDPRVAAGCIGEWLKSQGVQQYFSTPIIRARDGSILAADGTTWSAGRTVVCSGSDLRTLFPDTFVGSGIKLCKLQMLRSVAQPNELKQEAHVASGLTLRHYTSFKHCQSLELLKQRVARETPELDRFGIHVMATRAASGEFILGDSHEYGDDITPFDKSEIDELILRELRKIVQLPDWTIVERWHGIYAKHPEVPIFEAEPEPGVHVCVGPGGAGMTMSFGLAERSWKHWMGESE